MHETFNEIVSEISVRKVEMKMKSKPRLNLFENESDTFSIITSILMASNCAIGQFIGDCFVF